MSDFLRLLKNNRNYRYTWSGQVVSEVGDHFNNIAVFSLALATTHSGMVVTGVMLSRAIPAVMAGPLAGVVLDRMDRKRIMITSDLIRAVVALGFILAINNHSTVLLYALSALLMFASPFFTSGRSAILPTIASKEELHTANSLTQTTGWSTLTLGAFLGGASVAQLGYEWAFVFNALSFLFSALCISRLKLASGSFRARDTELNENKVVRPWHEYTQGLRYMRASPLILGIALLAVGWASGGGAAQILFSLFGELVFHRGPAGIGYLWASAGVGLLIGGGFAHWLGKRISFEGYKRTIGICYVIHGGSYVVFSQMPSFFLAMLFLALSRAAIAVSSVMNTSQLLGHVSNEFRGRVFATIETFSWSTMMLSMLGAGLASQKWPDGTRMIGAVSGLVSSSTSIFWLWANWSGRLPEPAREGIEPREVEVHGDPVV
ncbi:MAG TPA: MFS transporter [Bryobacteraceae bacterium]|nr:MFS transporter [Bryobacteraceae bacterium]